MSPPHRTPAATNWSPSAIRATGESWAAIQRLFLLGQVAATVEQEPQTGGGPAEQPGDENQVAGTARVTPERLARNERSPDRDIEDQWALDGADIAAGERASRCDGGGAESALDLEHVLEARARGGAERRRAPGRGRAHGGEIGERDRERAGAKAAWADPGPSEIDAFHQGILADGEIAPGLRGPHRGIVARAEDKGARRGPSDLGEGPQQRRFTDVGEARPPLVEAPLGHPISCHCHASAIYVGRPRGTVAAKARLALGVPSSLWCGGDVTARHLLGEGGG